MSCALCSTRPWPIRSSAGKPACRFTKVWPGRTRTSAMVVKHVNDVFIAILAGGEGTRLWPLSRSRRPKQLLQLGAERSLIQRTVDRLRPLVAPERILIVTERSHADDLHAQLPELTDSSIHRAATS